jgi:hypothetical protein
VGSVASGNDSTASTAGRGGAAACFSWRRGRAAFRREQRGLCFSRDQRGAVSFPADQGTEAELGRTIGNRTEPKQTTWPDRSTGGGTPRLAKRRGRREGNGCRSGTDERARACARERWPSAVGCVSSLCLSLPARWIGVAPPGPAIAVNGQKKSNGKGAAPPAAVDGRASHPPLHKRQGGGHSRPPPSIRNRSSDPYKVGRRLYSPVSSKFSQ